MFWREEAAPVVLGGLRIEVASECIGAAGGGRAGARRPSHIAPEKLRVAWVAVGQAVAAANGVQFHCTIHELAHVQEFLGHATLIAGVNARFDGGIQGWAVINAVHLCPTAADVGAIAVDAADTEHKLTVAKVHIRKFGAWRGRLFRARPGCPRSHAKPRHRLARIHIRHAIAAADGIHHCGAEGIWVDEGRFDALGLA